MDFRALGFRVVNIQALPTPDSWTFAIVLWVVGSPHYASGLMVAVESSDSLLSDLGHGVT